MATEIRDMANRDDDVAALRAAQVQIEHHVQALAEAQEATVRGMVGLQFRLVRLEERVLQLLQRVRA